MARRKRTGSKRRPARVSPRNSSKSRRQTSTKARKHAVSRRRRVAATSKKQRLSRKRLRPNPLVEIAVREMNSGRSLSAAARSVRLPPDDLRRTLKRLRLLKRKGTRWVINDERLRRVPVMTGGRQRNLIVRGFDQASLLGEYHRAVGKFLETNEAKFLKPFLGRAAEAANGRRYVLETDPNALHRIAAMDSPVFHEIYEITSNT